MVTVEDPRLAQIRALCDDPMQRRASSLIPIEAIRAVLDAPPVDATPPQGRRAGTEFTPGHSMNVVERVTPPQGIDRDALLALLRQVWSRDRTVDDAEVRILALVRPVVGVTLTSEEADLACTALRKVPWREQSNLDRSWALAARLEAAQ